VRCACRSFNVDKLLLCLTFALAASSAFGQVSPAEIPNLKLKAVEQKYLPQLQALHKAIDGAKFSFPFLLTRYVNSDPDRTSTFDSRGLEFVNFQGETVLKVSGIYRAAYDSDQLTENERAVHTFHDVIIPVLGLVAQQIPADVECDAIGFEIAYHTRDSSKNFAYEGRENLAIVMNRQDAFVLLKETDEQQQQTLLNRSAIYVNGKQLGLALSDRDAFDLEALQESRSTSYRAAARSTQASTGSPILLDSNPAAIPPHVEPRGKPSSSAGPAVVSPAASAGSKPPVPAAPSADPKATPTQADADQLQKRFQDQLDSLLRVNNPSLNLVDYASPSFAVYHDKLVLQLTLRNTLAFDKNASSIYKRAAQTFDLFLAPELKTLMQKLPKDAEFDALDFSVLNRFSPQKDPSEAIEFICPRQAVESFMDDQITNQDFINQSTVLVNGIRIALNLQLVE